MDDEELKGFAERIIGQNSKLADAVRAQQQKTADVLVQDQQAFVDLLTHGGHTAITDAGQQEAEPRPVG